MKTLFSLTLLAALAVPIYAVDGVVLINQSNALAGNVTPGDTPGFPVTISVSGSYKLSGNLTVPDGNTGAIVITADFVSLDLNGFSIIGPVVCSGGPPVTSCTQFPVDGANGIFSQNHNGLTISNGTIRGMGSSGIFLPFANSNRIVNIQAFSNASEGIGVGGPQNAIVSECIAMNNGGVGIEAEGTLSGNIAIGNRSDGFLTFFSTVVNNTATLNGGYGINGGGTISGNTSSQNVGGGIVAKCPSVVAVNSLAQNPGGNLFALGTGCVLVNNTP
jgi:hypothetical protein